MPAFKGMAGSNTNTAINRQAFNDLLAKPRVKSEHCIGLLKGWFPFLKNIRIDIKSRESLRNILRYVGAAVILHNLLIETPYEENWIDEQFKPLDDDDDLSQMNQEGLQNENKDTRNYLLGYLSSLEATCSRFV